MSKEPKINRISSEDRRVILEQIITFFDNERDEQIGIIAAEQLLSFFLEEIGNKIYNQGIIDAKAVLAKRIEDLNYDLDDLLDL